MKARGRMNASAARTFHPDESVSYVIKPEASKPRPFRLETRLPGALQDRSATNAGPPPPSWKHVRVCVRVCVCLMDR